MKTRYWFRGAFAAVLATMICVKATNPVRASDTTVSISFALFGDIDNMEAENGRGGFARLAAAVRAERARTEHVVVVHAGDTLSPSLMSGFDQGEHIIALMNTIAPDIFVPGNHEYDFGADNFLERMREARFPRLAANLTDADGKPLPGIAPTRMLEFAGVRIGVVGLTEENSASISNPGSLRMTSSVEAVRRFAAELRGEGADLVVAVAHAGRKRDLRILRTGDVDLLLSGHDHDLTVFFDGKSVLAEAKAQGEYLVVVELEVEATGEGEARRVSWWPGFRIIDTARVTPDPEVAARIADYRQTLSKELDVVLGTTETELDSRRATVRTGEAAIGNLFADALRDATGADVAILNGGGIRAGRVYSAGTALSRRDILTELPFRNKVVLVEMMGRDLLDALENGLWYADRPNGRFPHVSGVRIEGGTDGMPGRRIDRATVGGAPLDPEANYKVATNDFIARGSEGYDAFGNARILIGPKYGSLVANAVMAYIRKQGTVAPKVEGRIVLK